MKLKAFLKNNLEYVIYACFGVLFLIVALASNFTINSMFALNKPFEAVASLIRKTYSVENSFRLMLSYFIYFVFCCLPMVYPIVKLIRNKKFQPQMLIFFATSIFLFVMMYFFINPQNLSGLIERVGEDKLTPKVLEKMLPIEENFKSLTKLIFATTFILLVIGAVLVEISQSINAKSERVYFFAKRLVNVFVVYLLFSVLFLGVFSIKQSFKSIDSNSAEFFEINYSLNKFIVILSFVLKSVPVAFEIVLLTKVGGFLSGIKSDVFVKENLGKLKSIEKYSKLTVVAIIFSAIVDNCIKLILSKKLLDVNTSVDIPFVMIFAVCLIIIFAKILTRAIEINEENKLVI